MVIRTSVALTVQRLHPPPRRPLDRRFELVAQPMDGRDLAGDGRSGAAIEVDRFHGGSLRRPRTYPRALRRWLYAACRSRFYRDGLCASSICRMARDAHGSRIGLRTARITLRAQACFHCFRTLSWAAWFASSPLQVRSTPATNINEPGSVDPGDLPHVRDRIEKPHSFLLSFDRIGVPCPLSLSRREG